MNQSIKMNIKIFKPSLGFDFESKIVHIAVPLADLEDDKKGRKILKTKIYVITSDREFWPITEEQKEKRNLYPDKLPQFAIGEMRWSRENVRKFLEDKSGSEFNPYQEVFLPIKKAIESHIDLNNQWDSTLVTLWIIGTYIFPIFEAYPYLLLSGTRGSGKTKLLELLYKLSFNAEITSNATPPSIFRIIEANLSTILIDEGEMFSGKERDKELILLLNSGYKRSGVVTRVNKDTHQVERFQAYSPKAVAAINPLDSTLQSRFITINMIKTGSKDKGNARVSEKSADWTELRDRLYRFALLSGLEVAEVFQKSDKINLLNCRNNELWSPLLAIAEYLDIFSPEPSLFDSLSSLALEWSEGEDSLDDWHSNLLRALQQAVTIKKPYPLSDIRLAMCNFFEDAEESVKVTNHWVGNALRRFGFKPAKRSNKGSRYLLDPERVNDLLNRYEISVDGDDSDEDSGKEDKDNNGSDPTSQASTPTTQTSPEQSGLSDDDQRWVDRNVRDNT